MSYSPSSTARAVADLFEGQILASVEIAAPPERVFKALTSREIADWWIRPGIFDTYEWTGDVRKGGRWRASGVANGQTFALEGEYLEVDPPKKLVHTWRRVGAPGATTTVTYLLQKQDGGTRLTLRHSGFKPPEASVTTCAGWEASFERLAELLSTHSRQAGGTTPTNTPGALQPQVCALTYFTALENKDRAAIRNLLAGNGRFIGPLSSFTNADEFMKAADIFTQLVKKVDIKRVIADGGDVCVFWDYTTIVPTIPVIPIAAWFKIQEGKIKYVHLYFNPAAFVAALQRGEVAQALQAHNPG